MMFGAILAGGVGSRMNIESMPKQFLPLGSKPIFMHTLEKFLLSGEFDAVFIGVHKDWMDYTENEVKACAFFGVPVYVVCGGADRNGTIMNIVEAIEERYGEDEGNCIVTHDSVRPFVTLETLRANVAAMKECDACDTVIPATDTIVESGNGAFIKNIPWRGWMYQGQTPQSFKISALKRVYAALDEERKVRLTDACKMFVEAGIPVALVPGSATNIKLTTMMDYKVAQAMLESGIE